MKITNPKQRAFLKAFASLGVIRRAAKAAKISPTSHWNWLRQKGPEGDLYRRAFKRAQLRACELLEGEAFRRAVHGTERPVYQGGKLVGHIREYSDLLLMFLLKAGRPEKYRERSTIEHKGGLPAGPVEVKIDSNWYGNAERIAQNAHRVVAAGVIPANGNGNPSN